MSARRLRTTEKASTGEAFVIATRASLRAALSQPETAPSKKEHAGEGSAEGFSHHIGAIIAHPHALIKTLLWCYNLGNQRDGGLLGMTVDQNKSRISGRIWQAIAQSGIETANIPRDRLNAMVGNIADAVLQEFDAMLDQVELPQGNTRRAATPIAAGDHAEEVLWEGRPFLSLVQRYVLTSERMRIITGLVGRGYEDIELIRVKDVDHSQGISERMLNIGDVTLTSADPTLPVAVLRNVKDPVQVHETIRRAVLNARKRHPFSFQQEM
jgi:hypothetical protein